MAGQRKSKLTAAAEVRKGKKKKVVIIAVLAAAAALAAGVLIYQARQKRLAEEAMFQDEPSYEEVVRTDIERTYVSQGRIASLEEMVAGAQADEKSGYRVAEVFVKVGDAVHKGDPLYSLDLSSVEEEIRSQEEKLSLQQRSDAIDQSAAGRGTANAQAASSQTYYDETRALERQADDVNELIKKRDEAKEEFERLTEKEAVAKVWLDDAQAFYDATSGEGELCLPNLENAKANYIPIKADYDAAKSAYEAAEKALETAVRALEDLGSTVESGNRSALEAEASARDSAEKQRLSQQINAIDTQSELKKSYEKLENGTVYAKMDGTVTGVNVKPGELYSGQSAVTINDLASFKVTAEIDEGHIADLYVGMPVRVKTTSTGDEILEGVVSFASPTPTVEQAQASSQTQTQQRSTSSSSTKATYRVEITLKRPSERLRIGMSANIEFILQQAEAALAVPSACLIEDGMGGYFVQGEDGVERQVTTGISDNYYTEILSGEVNEGDLVQNPSADMGYGYGSDMLEGIY